nr:thiamine pyrophosphate-binding protein [Thermoanaerobaculia bacterium]
MSGGELVARVLERQGVRFLYTLCGGHISPILVAAAGVGIRVVDVRHEATAVFAADATARLTGVPGVAAVTAGPGVTNTLTALKNAQMAQSPVVLLGGATATVLKGRGALQDIDQRSLILPHVKRAWFVERVRDLPGALTEAFETALSGVPGPVFVECPVDLLYPEALVRSWYAAKTDREPRNLRERAERLYLRRHLDRLFAGADQAGAPEPRRQAYGEPPEELVAKAAALLSAAQRPLLVVGSQALAEAGQAQELARAVAELGIPTYLGGMARGLLGPDSPVQRRHERRQALREADFVLLAGFPCDFRLDYGSHIRGSACYVAVNRSRREARLNRRPNLTVVADPARFLHQLARAAPSSP